ncbi:hypothetical protein M9458_014685, partial [Cirrhinus mrigala]
EVPEVRFGGKAYRYWVLLFGLVLSPHAFTCAFSITQNHLSGHAEGFDHDAVTSVVLSRSLLQSRESKKAVHSLLNSSETVGSDGSCIQCDTFWPAVHETPTVVAQDIGVSPSGNQLCMIKVMQRCLYALDMWKKAWFLSLGPVLGPPCCRVTLAMDASFMGWGAVTSGRSAHDLWSGYHLMWHFNCLVMLAVLQAL